MSDHADSGEYGLHTNWENCEGGPCCDEALAIMEALVAERDEARRIVVQRDLELTATNCTLRYSREDLAAMKTRAEAAEAEVARWREGYGPELQELETLQTEVARLAQGVTTQAEEARTLREALTEAKAQIGHGAFCNCVVCSPLIAALGEDA